MTRFSPATFPVHDRLNRLYPRREPRPVEQLAAGLDRFPFRPLLANTDDDSAPILSDAGDSHYELPVTSDDELDDSQLELPAVQHYPDVRNDCLSASTDEFPSGEIVVTNPWYFDLVDSWARYHFVVALVFGILSLVILGFSLISASLGGRVVKLSVTAQIAGGLTLVVFSLLLVTATALNVVLVGLAKKHAPSERFSRT
jgi:hypothetical protein